MPHRLASAPNVNHLWAGLLVEELVRQGTTLFVVCPGSRSTPLAVAVGHHPQAEVLVHWDERAAGFVALGWGRATGRPAAVITTSGTAVANLLPAAVEADADGVPLLLLTADRPPELRETGANQTIRQPPMFSNVARWALDWPVPTPEVPARWVLSTAAHAAQRARLGRGPVHLNLPFREPLGAQADGTDSGTALAGVARWLDGNEPFSRLEETFLSGVRDTRDDVDALVPALRGVERGLVVMAADADAAACVEMAEGLGWPILADVRAPRPGRIAGFVSHADLLLVAAGAAQHLRPAAIVQVGDGRLTSKRLARLIAAAQPALYVQVTPTVARRDPDSLVTHRLPSDPAVLTLALRDAQAAEPMPGRQGDWMAAWRRADQAADKVLHVRSDGLSEPAVARRLTDAGLPILAAASMPIRDLEAYGRGDRVVEVVANRGASGIDGTVATAHGVARGLGNPVALLIGDLALLHDQTSLALLRSGPPVVVVCVNNDGGGIFHRLPIADGPGAIAPEAFERFFGTPHGLTFAHAAAQVGLAYTAPETLGAFDAALAEAVASGASALIEVRTDRAEQAALRRRIEAAVADAVDAALAE